MAQMQQTDAEQDIEQVANLLHGMLQDNPSLSIYDVRRRNEQGWNFAVRYDSRRYPDDAARTRVEGLRLSSQDLDKAWAKARRLHAGNEFAWM